MSPMHSLSVFLAVAEEGNFTSAARKLNLTQPTVSFHIDNLEKHFGCPLFIRTGKGVALTAYGEKLYKNTLQFHQILTQTYNEIRGLAEGSAGHILLGASTIPGDYILPRLIADFLHTHPGVKFTLETSDSKTILSGYQNGQFPIGIIGMKPEGSVPCRPLWDDELILVGHPELVRQISPITDIHCLGKVPLILRTAPSGSRKTVFDTLCANRLDPAQLNVVLEVSGNESLKTAILHKGGVGFISRWAVQKELAANLLQAVSLPGVKISRTFYVLYQQPLMPTCLQLFLDYLLNADPNILRA